MGSGQRPRQCGAARRAMHATQSGRSSLTIWLDSMARSANPPSNLSETECDSSTINMFQTIFYNSCCLYFTAEHFPKHFLLLYVFECVIPNIPIAVCFL